MTDEEILKYLRKEAEKAFEADGSKLNRCACGSAELVDKPNSDVGWVCGGCGIDV